MIAQMIWQSPDLLSVALVMLALGVSTVLWLYPPQIRSTRRIAKWALPVLRVMAIVAIAVSVLRPVTARPHAIEHKGAIVVLVDQSRSMSVSDGGRSPAQSVALADGLGLLPPGVRVDAGAGLRSELDRLIELVDDARRARSEADYARLAGRGVDEARRRLERAVVTLRNEAVALATRSGAVPAGENLPERVAELRRLPVPLDDRALAELHRKLQDMSSALETVQQRADAALYRTDERVRQICNDVDAMSRLELTETAINELASKLPGAAVQVYGFSDRARSVQGALQVDQPGQVSDITGALRYVSERVRGQGVQAIVLLSDGRQVGGEGEGVERLAIDVPVFAVSTAPGQARRDVAITRVTVPPTVFAGQTATVQVELRGTACEGMTVDVRLDEPGRRQVQQVTFRDATTATVQFDVTFTQRGAVELGVSVPPLPDELSEENNHAQRWVKVLSDQIEVTAAAGVITRDFQLLSESLEAAPWVTLRQSLLTGDGDTLGLTPREILEQNVLILCDVRLWSLTARQWDAVHQMVTQGGGSLILAVGDSQVLRDYTQDALLSRLLPFDPATAATWRIWTGPQPQFRLVPAPRGIEPDAPELRQWQYLSPVMRFYPMPYLKPNARALLVERESGAAALTEARLGSGRVFFLGTDETWRWMTRQGDDLHDPFWRALVRRAAGEPYAVQEGNYWLDVDRVWAEPTQPVHVRAKVLRYDGAPARAASQELQIFRDDRMARTVTLRPATPLGSGKYEAQLVGLEEAHYHLQLNTGDDFVRSPRLSLRIGKSAEAEMADLSGDEQHLRRIAESTGGELLSLEQLATLPRRLHELRQEETLWTEYRLWDSPYLFLLVLGCLTAEWALRKRFGLA